MSLASVTKQLFALLKPDPIKDTTQLLDVCNTTARLCIARDAKKVALDAEVAALKELHDGPIEQLNREIAHHEKRILAYCTEHRAEHFGKRQEFILAGHEMAFRKSPGAVGFKEGVTADDVVAAILALDDGAGDKLREALLRVSAELEKKTVLRELRTNLNGGKETLTAIGVIIQEKESFSFTHARLEHTTTEATPDLKEAA